MRNERQRLRNLLCEINAQHGKGDIFRVFRKHPGGGFALRRIPIAPGYYLTESRHFTIEDGMVRFLGKRRKL